MRVACIVLLVARLNFYTLLIYAKNLHDDEVVVANENFNVNASAPNSLTVSSYASDRKTNNGYTSSGLLQQVRYSGYRL